MYLLYIDMCVVYKVPLQFAEVVNEVFYSWPGVKE